MATRWRTSLAVAVVVTKLSQVVVAHTLKVRLDPLSGGTGAIEAEIPFRASVTTAGCSDNRRSRSRSRS